MEALASTAGEILGLLGAALIVIGILLATIRWGNHRKAKRKCCGAHQPDDELLDRTLKPQGCKHHKGSHDDGKVL